MEKRYRKSDKAIADYKGKNHEDKPGEFFIAVPYPIGQEELPTYNDWLEWEANKGAADESQDFIENGTEMSKFISPADRHRMRGEELGLDKPKKMWQNPDLEK